MQTRAFNGTPVANSRAPVQLIPVQNGVQQRIVGTPGQLVRSISPTIPVSPSGASTVVGPKLSYQTTTPQLVNVPVVSSRPSSQVVYATPTNKKQLILQQPEVLTRTYDAGIGIEDRKVYDAEVFDPEKAYQPQNSPLDQERLERLEMSRLNRPKRLVLKKFGWSVLFCLCAKSLTAAQFLRSFFTVQVIHDIVMILILAGLGFVSFLITPALIAANIAVILLFVTSAIFSCFCMNQISSADLKTRYSGPYFLGLVFAFLSSLTSTLIMVGLAAALIVVFVLKIIFNFTTNPFVRELDRAIAALFVFVAILVLVVALFSLSQVLMACVGCQAANQIKQLRRIMQYEEDMVELGTQQPQYAPGTQLVQQAAPAQFLTPVRTVGVPQQMVAAPSIQGSVLY